VVGDDARLVPLFGCIFVIIEDGAGAPKTRVIIGDGIGEKRVCEVKGGRRDTKGLVHESEESDGDGTVKEDIGDVVLVESPKRVHSAGRREGEGEGEVCKAGV